MSQQQEVILKLVNAVLETCRECGPQGAPGGVLYSALMGIGLSYEQFMHLMSALVAAGKLRHVNQCYIAI